jgi:hypothetical protein
MLERDSNVIGSTPAIPAHSSDALDGAWKRLPFFRTFLRLLMPLAIVLVVNLALYTAIYFSTPQSYEAVSFWYRFFDANSEQSVPTWINATLWALSALAAGYIAYNTTALRRSWWLFTSVCVVLSIDEAVSLHERLEPLGEQLGTGLRFAWVIPGVILAALIVLLLIRMVLTLPATSRNGLIISGIVFMVGSVGVETIAGFVYAGYGGSGLYALLGTVEEGFEILGVVVCLVSLLHLFQRRRLGTGILYRVAPSRAQDMSDRSTEVDRP